MFDNVFLVLYIINIVAFCCGSLINGHLDGGGNCDVLSLTEQIDHILPCWNVFLLALLFFYFYDIHLKHIKYYYISMIAQLSDGN